MGGLYWKYCFDGGKVVAVYASRPCVSDLADMEALMKQDDFGDMEQQATLRRVMCAEPIIIQENERICVVRESGPARTFTAM